MFMYHLHTFSVTPFFFFFFNFFLYIYIPYWDLGAFLARFVLDYT